MNHWHDGGPRAAILADGKRLHLQHGPIDLVVFAEGDRHEVISAYRQATDAFQSVLVDLVDELPLLRRNCEADGRRPTGRIAAAMYRAAVGHRPAFVTPMIAVAGAVADHVLRTLRAGRRLRRAYVNNGGDIALYLAQNTSYSVGICADPHTGRYAGTVNVASGQGIGGVATSGWRGRSHSMGIADAVTVLAPDAATADAAATMIANEVTLDDCCAIDRRPARDLAPDSDLGDRLVTVDVSRLSPSDVAAALDRGAAHAKRLVDQDIIVAAFLGLQDDSRAVGDGTLPVDARRALRRHRFEGALANA